MKFICAHTASQMISWWQQTVNMELHLCINKMRLSKTNCSGFRWNANIVTDKHKCNFRKVINPSFKTKRKCWSFVVQNLTALRVWFLSLSHGVLWLITVHREAVMYSLKIYMYRYFIYVYNNRQHGKHWRCPFLERIAAGFRIWLMLHWKLKYCFICRRTQSGNNLFSNKICSSRRLTQHPYISLYTSIHDLRLS